MSAATRNRGKSGIVHHDPNKLTINHHPNEASPLRIEPVTPGVNRTINRSIHRSYSTLSSGYIKKVANHQPEVDGKKLNGIIGHATSNIVQHGFWRIQRSTKDKEKLPDRINLDRRGLTTLPLIEDEPNLRLLSLQHNLINSFCVPGGPNQLSDNETNEKKIGNGDTGKKSISVISNVKHQHSRRLMKTQSVQKPSSSSSSSASRNLQVPQSAKPNGHIGKGAASNASLSVTPTSAAISNASMKNSFIQKSVLLHAKERYVLRKSTSFINSYSRHLSATKAHLGRLIQSRANGNGNGANGIMSSFSSDSTQDIELKPQADSLIIQNDHSYIGFADSLQNLVFLDLYDNQIEKISNLDGLKSLTVLLLGKNRISDITGIVSLRNSLRVLDLHGNKISQISQKICQLHELKSLNLAGNALKQIQVDDFKGLLNLKELNLKRNRIKKIHGFEDLRSLERLWLCHNDLQKVEDMSSIAKALTLREVTIENNPVSLGGDCVSFLVSYLPNLCLLSQMQVTEQVRRAAMAWRRGKETSDAKYSHLSSDVCHTIRREATIANARTNWELLRSQSPINKNLSFIDKSIKNNSQVPVSEVDGELFSDLSENVNVDPRVIRQKTFLIRKNLRKPAKLRRSTSQETISGGADKCKQEEIFRLPPILAPFIEPKQFQSQSGSNSSTGANIDSASSCLNSENEDENKPVTVKEVNNYETFGSPSTPVYRNEDIELIHEPSELQRKLLSTANAREILTTTQMYANKEEIRLDDEPIRKRTPPEIDAPSDTMVTHTKPTVPILAIEDSDKISNLSVTSMKCTSDISSERYQKCKSASTTKKNNQNPLQRANTAKTVIVNTPTTPAAVSTAPKQHKPTTEREREQGGDYLIEICGRYLNIYGAGAIKFIDRQWNTQKANDVHTLKFSYLNFNSIAPILNRIKIRFPNAENFLFRETNINGLGQLNALAELQGISSLIIDAEGNLICTKSWRLYAVYRLSHWGIKTINDMNVTDEEINEAQKAYSGLSDLVLWSLPETLLEPLLLRLRLDETCTAGNAGAKQWLMDADPSLKSVVGKEALQCKVTMGGGGGTSGVIMAAGITQSESDIRYRGRNHFSTMMANTYNAVDKLQKLETLWPNLLLEMIKNTLLDYAQIDVYVRNLMTELNTTPLMPPGKH